MIPFFAKTEGQPVVNVPAPLNFKPLKGMPRDVHDISLQLQVGQKGNTEARKAGLRYEGTVIEYLEDLAKHSKRGFCEQPALRFRDDNGWRIVVPDALLISDVDIILVEIKIQHMPEAWWQLRRLYEPVVLNRYLRPVRVLEIVKSFDASMPFPEPVEQISAENMPLFCLSQIARGVVPKFAVHVWKP